MENSGKIQPGEVRNPNGRPKKEQAITHILNEYLNNSEFGEKKITGKQVLVQKLFQLAAQGDMAALKYCIDRIDGPIVTAVKQVDDDGNAIVPAIQVSFVKPNES